MTYRDQPDVFSICWQSIQKCLRSQTLWNFLLVLFTGLLAFLSYVTERPQVAVHITPLRNFVKGGTPREVIVFENVGRLPANSLQSGVELRVLQSPLGNSHFTEMPLTSIPFDLFAGTENEKGRAVDLQQPISDTDYAAVLEVRGRWRLFSPS
jgi:hypothetical protein